MPKKEIIPKSEKASMEGTRQAKAEKGKNKMAAKANKKGMKPSMKQKGC